MIYRGRQARQLSQRLMIHARRTSARPDSTLSEYSGPGGGKLAISSKTRSRQAVGSRGAHAGTSSVTASYIGICAACNIVSPRQPAPCGEGCLRSDLSATLKCTPAENCGARIGCQSCILTSQALSPQWVDRFGPAAAAEHRTTHGNPSPPRGRRTVHHPRPAGPPPRSPPTRREGRAGPELAPRLRSSPAIPHIQAGSRRSRAWSTRSGGRIPTRPLHPLQHRLVVGAILHGEASQTSRRPRLQPGPQFQRAAQHGDSNRSQDQFVVITPRHYALPCAATPRSAT